MSDQNYYGREEISNSDLGELKVSPRRFLMRKQKEMQTKSSAMELGTLIHTFALEPDKFIMADIEPVSGKMGEYIKAYYELERSGMDEKEIPEAAYRHSQYSPKHSKPETILKSFKNKPENVAFYNFLKDSEGKIAISQKDRQIINGCLTSLRSHAVSNRLLFSEKEGVTAEAEKEIFFSMHGVNCKSKLDRVLIDEENKEITIVDLKTTSKQVYGECIPLNTNTGHLIRDWHVTGFMYSCLNYSYYRQLAFYIQGMQELYPDYKVEGFIVAVDTQGSYDVAVYKLPKEWLEQGNEEIKCLLTEYKHYQTSSNWDVKQGFEELVEY
jgi:hypothetical protein